VPVIADTAYPRLPADPGLAALEAFTPEAAEIAFARQRTRQAAPRLALLVLLKTFQRLGYFVRLADVPVAVIAHVAAISGPDAAVPDIGSYDGTTYRVRLSVLVRRFVGVEGMTGIKAARTRDDLADMVNAGIEELLRCRRELPAFGTLLKLARSARVVGSLVPADGLESNCGHLASHGVCYFAWLSCSGGRDGEIVLTAVVASHNSVVLSWGHAL
jgi:hypothetical protein